MAGIYIHIPFCKTKCIYCDFFSGTNESEKERFIDRLCREINERKSFLNNEAIKTLYFGGGTPSQLSETDFTRIFNVLNTIYDLSVCDEITIEVNPDDITPEYAQMLRKYPFNRVSMGIQSFNDCDLRFLRRRHDASQAVNAIEILNGVGFNNISIDLIYGLPGQTLEAWSDNLDKAFKLNITHLSAYHLIYEEGTTMYKLMQSGKIIPVNEDLSLEMFKMLIEKAGKNNLLQYEISNFAKKGLESRHNSSYWDNQKYIGFGPGAHSYDGEKREYNISDLKVYLNDEEYYDTEVLSDTDKYNELILTSIRTMKGLDLNLLKSRFPDKYEYCISMAEKSIEKKLLKIESERLSLTTEGIFLSDSIMSDLIFID